MARPTAAQIRDRALAQLAGTTLDTQIGNAIIAADQAIALHCLFPQYSSGLHTLDKDVSGSYTLYYDGPCDDDPRRLALRLRPIVSITSVSQDINGDFSYSESLVENTDYVLDPERGELHWHPNSTKPFLAGRRRIKVVCVAGYDLDNHETLMQAIALTVAAWFTYRAGHQQVTQISQGSNSASLAVPRKLPPLVRELVEPYVLWDRQVRY